MVRLNFSMFAEMKTTSWKSAELNRAT
jgi:hypothetical protein